VPEEFKPDNLTYVQLQPGAEHPWGEGVEGILVATSGAPCHSVVVFSAGGEVLCVGDSESFGKRIASPARVASDGRFLIFVDEGTFAPRAHVTCLSLDLQPLGQWELQPNEDLRTQPGFNRNYTTRGPVALELSTHGGGTLWACYRSAHRIAAFDAAEMCARGGRTGVSAAGKPRVGTAPARFSFGGNDEEGTIPPFPADEWHSRVMASRRKRGALSSPCAFTVSEGRVYVCDRENHRISVFSADDGAYRHCFSTFGDAPGCVRGPAGVAFAAGHVLVTEGVYGRRIQAFTPEGESRAILCPPGGKQPMLRGLCVGPRGRIYAADRCNDLIHLIQLRR